MSRALVLGGGGVAGIAWETGLLFGLAEHGVDVRTADLVVGTSAGSTMGAQLLSGTSLRDLYDRHLDGGSSSTEIGADFDAENMVAEWGRMLSEHSPGRELRAAIGGFALAASTPPESVRRAVVEGRLPSHDWPETPLHIVVVDAESGEDRVLTRADGVPLVDAVAASCAVPGIWPPVTIGEHRYVDGGVRTSANVDLAEGHDVVLVLAPVPDFLQPEPTIEARLARMRASSRVVTIRPDEASVAAIGSNPLDPSTARPAALAGRAQADAVVAQVAAAWS